MHQTQPINIAWHIKGNSGEGWQMLILLILFSVGRDVKYLSGILSGLLGIHLMYKVTKKHKLCTVQGVIW